MFTIAQAALPSPACPNISLVLVVALPAHSMCKTSASHHTFSLWDNPRKKQFQRVCPSYITIIKDAFLFNTTLGSRHRIISSGWARFTFSGHFQDSSKPTTQQPSATDPCEVQGAHLCSEKVFCAVKYSADWMSKGEETSAKRLECLRPNHLFTLKYQRSRVSLDGSFQHSVFGRPRYITIHVIQEHLKHHISHNPLSYSQDANFRKNSGKEPAEFWAHTNGSEGIWNHTEWYFNTNPTLMKQFWHHIYRWRMITYNT